MELTENSPVIGQPKNIIKPLTKYQKAMLYKSLVEIEKGGKKFGFIGDKPGVGKTAVILSLIVAEKIINKESQTIIVVPQNLLSQWKSEIEKFCKDTKVLDITTYADTREFYDEDNIKYLKSFDIFLTTSTIYKLLIDTMSSIDYRVKRIVFDEVDTVENLFDNLAISELRSKRNKMYDEHRLEEKQFYDIVWYVSASINNLFDDDVFSLGNLKLSREEFSKHYVKCSDEFIEAHSLVKNKIQESIVNCDSVADIYGDYLSIEQLDHINSISYNKIIGEYTAKSAIDEKQTILIIVEDYHLHYKEICEKINTLEKKILKAQERFKKTDELEEILLKEQAACSFYKECLENFYKILDVNTYEEFCDKYKNEDVKTNKLEKIKDYLETTDANKIIIFSDHTDGFNHLIKFFIEKELKYTDLGKGNLKDIDKAIKDYKEGDIKFLLIDSASEGCGLNLENTDEILFIHRINETLRYQMIGRALRPGRKGDLKIITFLNKNEEV